MRVGAEWFAHYEPRTMTRNGPTRRTVNALASLRDRCWVDSNNASFCFSNLFALHTWTQVQNFLIPNRTDTAANT